MHKDVKPPCSVTSSWISWCPPLLVRLDLGLRGPAFLGHVPDGATLEARHLLVGSALAVLRALVLDHPLLASCSVSSVLPTVLCPMPRFAAVAALIALAAALLALAFA
eukprot:404654-Heterocapsa_arctica.AAC.1